jgi:hypothetical protein
MGIRVKNLHNAVLSLRSAGTLTAATNKDIAIVPFAGCISNICALSSTHGVGSTDTVVDINKNGTTIFGAATKITLDGGTTTVSYSALTSQPTMVAAGDVLTMDIDSVGSTFSNLEVLITISKTRVDVCGTTSNHATVL